MWDGVRIVKFKSGLPGRSGSARLVAAALVTGVMLAGGTASAQSTRPYGGVALGVTAGTLGIGLEASVKTADWLVLRANGSGFKYDTSQTVDGNAFDFKTSLVSAGLIADFHPFSGGFRLSLGGRYHDMKLSGSAKIDGTISIGDHDYTAAQIGKLTGTITGEKFAPYIGLGYDSAHDNQGPFSLSLDVGALYLGEPSAKLSTDQTVAGLDADLRKEEADINKSINAFGFYPVVQLAAKYRF